MLMAAHSFTEDSKTRLVERVAPGTGKVTMPTTAQLDAKTAAGIYPASVIDIQGKARIIIKSSFSIASATSAWKALLYDSVGDLIGCLPNSVDIYTTTAAATEQDEDSRYIGTMSIINNDVGAAGLKIRMTGDPSSGNVSFFIAGL